MRFFTALRALALLSLALVSCAKDVADISATQLPSEPSALFFFDDTESVLIYSDEDSTVYLSENAGKDWQEAPGLPKGQVLALYMNPHDNRVAIALGMEKHHWITKDRGKSWKAFATANHPSLRDAVSFHATDIDRILYHTFDDALLTGGIGKTFYTIDGFDSLHPVHERRRMCVWAKSEPLFATGDDKTDLNRIVCVVEGKYSHLSSDYKILVSDDLFQTSKEPSMSDSRTVSGFVNMAAVKGFIVAAAKARGSAELALYVTKDAETWHRAVFGDHKIEEDAYTILESTNYSIQVDVTPNRRVNMGTLFSSNSNGTYFTKNAEHANRNGRGIMDFEKVQNIQGIFLINVVDNWKEVEDRPNTHKRLKSQITFDDGRTFEDVKSGGDKLHLHSVTELSNSGRVYSSPAPGIIMGNGNTGDSLSSFDSASLFISDDAGKSWIKAAMDGPQKYEFGDQGSILVAVPNGRADHLSFSLDHGKTWTQQQLGKEIVPFELTTIPDSTILKFILTGHDNEHWYTFSIDFAGLHERTCTDDDFEMWYARKDANGKPACIMGHTQHFRRRKPDAGCFINTAFQEALPISEPCDCTVQDFECDYNFRLLGDTCEPVGPVLDTEHHCTDRSGSFRGSSGWRLIPGNDCKRGAGEQKDALVNRPCSAAFKAPASGNITSKFETFPGSTFISTHYLERDPKATGDDETVVFLTDKARAYKSRDHGKTWSNAVPDDDVNIVAIYPHQYNNDYVYFITPTRRVYYSKDRGHLVHRFEAPDVPNINGLPIISFHQKHPDWILWTGDQDCYQDEHRYCKVTAHVSKLNGELEDSWTPLLPYVRRCQFMYREGRANSEDLVYCEHWKAEDIRGPLQLLSTEDNFGNRNTEFASVVDFATMAEFIIVAAREDDKYLSAHASVDGKVFAHAAFPHNFHVEHEQAYTVLDSATNSIFLHVTTSGLKNREYGTILKSNSNGTSYVVSISGVNRDGRGYVDWEKMQGLEGVALVNTISNIDELNGRGTAQKKLQTVITHDDGATWAYLPCPDKDLDGDSYNCDPNNLEKRSLHLHGYTERGDPRDGFSSPSAIGVMIGVGNVGDHLGLYNEGDTFLTTDGGITWKQVQKGTYLCEYGDQGGIIVLVAKNTATNKLIYTTDEGITWTTWVFDHDGYTTVERITTVPSDNSRNFLLWGKKDGRLTTVNLDFTGLSDVQCKLDKDHVTEDSSDYALWSPKHPGKLEEPECLFGHKPMYYRKKPDRQCYNGPLIDRLHDRGSNCSCTREDFEW
jgi:photosystem II stability/assembly factor-like uncharacterized protein